MPITRKHLEVESTDGRPMLYVALLEVNRQGMDGHAQLVAIVHAESVAEAKSKLAKGVAELTPQRLYEEDKELCPRGGEVHVLMSVAVAPGDDFIGLLQLFRDECPLLDSDPFGVGYPHDLFDTEPSTAPDGQPAELVKPIFSRPSLKELLEP